MSGTLAHTLDGLGEQLALINASVDAATRERNKDLISDIIRLTEAAPALIERFGDQSEPVVKMIITSLIQGVQRLGTMEILLKGNIERSYSWGVEAKGSIGVSWANLSASGFYTQAGGESHGTEIRLGYVGGIVKDETVSAFVTAWQARAGTSPVNLDILEDIVPLLERLFGQSAPTPADGE